MRLRTVRGRRLARIRELEGDRLADAHALTEMLADGEVREADLADALVAVRTTDHGHPRDATGRPLSSVRCEVCRIVDGAL